MTYEPPQNTEIEDAPDVTEDETFLRMLQELEQEEVEEETPAAEEEVEEEETPDPTTDLKWVFEDGLEIDRGKARNLALFDAWLGANPLEAARLAGVAQGELDVVPLTGRGVPDASITGTIPTTPANIAATNVPEDIDMDDPVQRRIWNELQETRQQIAQQNELLQRHQEQIDQTSRNTTEALVKRISEEYREKNGLSADDLSIIRRRAAQLIPQFTNPIDPETGLPRQIDPVYAIEQSLDAAKWSIPEFRNRALESLAKDKLDDLRKKSKLTSLGGTSGSVPRKATTPSTDEERRQAMIREVAAEMSGGHSG